MKLERYEEATGALKKALRINPYPLADFFYDLGVCSFQTGRMEEAIRFFEIYREKADFETRVEAYRLLGQVYLKKYKFHKALSCFERIEYLEKPSWESLLNLGVAYFGTDQFEKARRSFEQAEKIKSDSLKVIFNLAVVYEKMGLTEKAKEMYKKASQIRAQTPEEKTLIEKSKERIK